LNICKAKTPMLFTQTFLQMHNKRMQPDFGELRR